MTYFVDITDEKRPFTLSNYQVPEAAGGYCKRGGRFGAHSDYIEEIPSYMFEWLKKYKTNIYLMVEAKKKELAVLKLKEKYKKFFFDSFYNFTK